MKQIRELWYKCAQSTGNVVVAAMLLLEKMCSGAFEPERFKLKMPEDGENVQNGSLQEDLISLLKVGKGIVRF